MKRRRLLAWTLVLALAAGAWFWQYPPAATPEAKDNESAAQATITETESHSGQMPRESLPPMPPADREFGLALPDLKTRADAGDRKAACRLASGLLRCLHAPALWGGTDIAELERQTEANGQPEVANYFAEEQAWLLEVASECRDVPDGIKNEGARYLRQAALAGDPAAMLAYGSGQHFNPSGRGIAVGPAFDTWRREAPVMLRRALLAGHPSAAPALSMAYLDDMGILNAFVANDAYQGAVHHMLSAMLFGTREYPGWLEGLDAQELERARREATRLHENVFAGKRYDRNFYFVQPMHYRRNPDAPLPCETPK